MAKPNDGSRRGVISRLVSFADAPADDDDARLRKRVGIIAGYLTIVAPLTLPAQAGFAPVTWALGLGLAIFSVANLAVLALTRNFDRYVIALVAAGTVWVPVVTIVGGGVTGQTAGLAWAFLAPAYAIMALGPRRATPWFVLFLVSLAVMWAVDPWARATFGVGSYEARLTSTLLNAAMPLTILFILLRWTDARRRTAEARADALLTNAIPASIARRLKHGENRIAEAYPETTVLFADISGFTPWAGQTDPDRVVGLLDDLFSRFDALASAAGVEKIKTIGDAYMAVAGAPEPVADHARRGLALGRAMLAAFGEWRRDAGSPEVDLRIGIASGDVTGGVIGRQRILFDLWGATVNTASRMESHGISGRIQVAESTWQRLGRPAELEPRALEVKGLGVVTAYVDRPAT
jgi:guanylate cyclase